MNSRERTLAISLLALVLVLGVGGMVHLFLLKPLSDLGNRINETQAQLDKKRGELLAEQRDAEKIKKLDPRLKDWQKISLPDSPSKDPDEIAKHLRQVQVDYEEKLSTLLRTHRVVRNVKVTPQPPDLKSAPQLPGRIPMYKRLSFTVEATTTLASLVETLEAFYRMPLLQEIRVLSVSRPQTIREGGNPGDLDVKMTIDALVVQGAEKRTELLPPSLKAPPQVLGREKTGYEGMLARNIFTGTTGGVDRMQTEPRDDVLRFVKLTSITYSYNQARDEWAWVAKLYDQGKGGSEIKLVLNSVSFSDCTIKDRFEHDLMVLKLVDILDRRSLLFGVGDKYYRMEVGDFVLDAMKRGPLRDIELPENLRKKKETSEKSS